MKNIMLILLCLVTTSILPNAVSADCILVEFFDNFIIREDTTVILYNDSVGLVKIDLECSVQQDPPLEELSL